MRKMFIKSIKALMLCSGIVCFSNNMAGAMEPVDPFFPSKPFKESLGSVADYVVNPEGKVPPSVPEVDYINCRFEKHKYKLCAFKYFLNVCVRNIAEGIVDPNHMFLLRKFIHCFLIQEVYYDLLQNGIDPNDLEAVIISFRTEPTDFQRSIVERYNLATQLFQQNIGFRSSVPIVSEEEKKRGKIVEQGLLFHLAIKHNIPDYVIPQPSEEEYDSVKRIFNPCVGEFIVNIMKAVIAGEAIDDEYLKTLYTGEGISLVSKVTNDLIKEGALNVTQSNRRQYIRDVIDMVRVIQHEGRAISESNDKRFKCACLLMIGFDLSNKSRLSDFCVHTGDEYLIAELFRRYFLYCIRGDSYVLSNLRRALSLLPYQRPPEPDWIPFRGAQEEVVEESLSGDWLFSGDE